MVWRSLLAPYPYLITIAQGYQGAREPPRPRTWTTSRCRLPRTGADPVQDDLSSKKAFDSRDECEPAEGRRWRAD
jgi:hypothetical protein